MSYLEGDGFVLKIVIFGTKGVNVVEVLFADVGVIVLGKEALCVDDIVGRGVCEPWLLLWFVTIGVAVVPKLKFVVVGIAIKLLVMVIFWVAASGVRISTCEVTGLVVSGFAISNVLSFVAWGTDVFGDSSLFRNRCRFVHFSLINCFFS